MLSLLEKLKKNNINNRELEDFWFKPMMQIIYIISLIILICSANSPSEWIKIDNCSYEHMEKSSWGPPQCFLQISNSHYKCVLLEECETKIAPYYITSSFDVCAFSSPKWPLSKSSSIDVFDILHGITFILMIFFAECSRNEQSNQQIQTV